MSNKTYYPGYVAQTTGGKYKTFDNKDNIKTASGYAECHVGGKSASLNRPSTIIVNRFNANIPNGAMITKVTVRYKHSKAKYNNKDCNVQAPTISLMNGDSVIRYGNGNKMQRKGQAPTPTATESKIDFNSTIFNLSVINSNNFKVKVDYPTNANDNEGYVRLYYVKVIIEWTTSSYGLNIKHIEGEYNGDRYFITVDISNKKLTKYKPTITLTVEDGFSFVSHYPTPMHDVSYANYTFTRVDATTFRIVPDFSKKAGACTVTLLFDSHFTYATGVGYHDALFNVTESLNNTSKQRYVRVTKDRPVDPSVDPDTSQTTIPPEDSKPENEKIVFVKMTEPTNLALQFTPEEIATWNTSGARKVCYMGFYEDDDFDRTDFTTTDAYVKRYYASTGNWVNLKGLNIKDNDLDEDGNWLDLFKLAETATAYSTPRNITICIYTNNYGQGTLLRKIHIQGYRDDVTNPYFSVLTPSTEELNRLGDGYNYTAQSFLSLTGRSIYLQDKAVKTDTIASGELYTSHGSISDYLDDFVIEFDIKATGDRADLIFASDTNEIAEHYFGVSLNLNLDTLDCVEKDSLGVPLLEDVSSDTYYTVKIVRETDSFKFYVDNTLKTTQTISWVKNYNTLYLFTDVDTGSISLKNLIIDSGSGDSFVRDWNRNFRIGVFNNPIWSNITYTETTDPETGETIQVPTDSTDYTSLTTSQIFSNAEYLSNPPSKVNVFESLECDFIYNSDYPLYILIVGDYTEAGDNMASIKYTEPVIVEAEVSNGYEENGVYPIPINDLVLSDGSSAELTIGALNNASPLIFYNWPLDEDYGTNDEIAIRGLEIRGTIESNTDNIILHASLKNGKQETRQRSLTLDELDNTLTDENQFSIGGIGDLWGFSTLDIINLEDWEAHLTISNILNDTTGGINFRDIQLVIYIENIENQLVKTYIEGQDVSYYGAFLTDLKIPEGLKTDTAYLDINGTDTNDPYRQNIKEKTIEATFDIGDCDIEGSTLSLREFTRLLVNERDQYNKPIPKRIEFSHYPDVYWEYILEDTFDNDLEISTYNVKVKLVIPAGTSYDKNTTKTNDVGHVSGLAHVRPTIQFKPTSTLIAIREDVTEQEFHMSYTEEWLGKVIEIDCDNRIVLLKEDDDDTDGENITNYVDFSSDWFTILGEYQFQTVGCAIMNIQYQERW